MGMTSKEAITEIEEFKKFLLDIVKKNHDGSYNPQCESLDKAVEALHLLEKQEKGLVQVLPCKVGDTAYFPYMDETTKKSVICPWIVNGIALKKDGWYAIDKDENCDKIGGEYCYLTREEAEAKLAEMESSHDKSND